ncbi:MAG: hypothetical protein M3Y84_01530 [Acidobacteriota bacterium]|nr:hypothetical protein [Acidobacteriota bacterium]
MNCRSVRREIDEAKPGNLLSSIANHHIENCFECETFADEHLKLQEIISSLGTVAAPEDFEFRLRARLAGEKRGPAQPFALRNHSFGFRFAAFATTVLLIGSALLFVSLRSPSDSPRVLNQPIRDTNKTNLTEDNKQSAGQQNAPPLLPSRASAAQASQTVPEVKFSAIERHGGALRGQSKLATVASTRETAALKTRDLSSTSAAVVKRSDQLAEAYPTRAFLIQAPYQSLKVSLDDGRGSSRTISLPSVSFGSQRVLAKGPSPLLESPRGSW